MHCAPRTTLGLCLLLAVLGAAGCNRWRPQQAHDVAGLADPNATFAVVLDSLKSQRYSILDQDLAAHSVRVRAHTDESDPNAPNVIQVRVDSVVVHLSASGHLVHPDGTTHHALNTELASLQKQIQKALSAIGSAPAPGMASPPAAAAQGAPGSLPSAWSEPAYDPRVWGHGNFTCLPVKLADADQAQLTLRLSNGENADVLLSLAHAPELCRSPAACKLAGGCPALGMADAERVSRLAGRLSRREIGALATLFSHGQPVATIDLSQHGSIAQELAEKH
jgi:hypothetical protein